MSLVYSMVFVVSGERIEAKIHFPYVMSRFTVAPYFPLRQNLQTFILRDLGAKMPELADFTSSTE